MKFKKLSKERKRIYETVLNPPWRHALLPSPDLEYETEESQI